MSATKIRGLQQWCRRMTEGYAHVDIENFTSSWRDGLAFCALIHRFRPDLIDYESLSPENVFENCKLAFDMAETELDIPAFLDAEDMAKLKAPDKLSVITYISEYYNCLSELPQLGGPGVRSRVTNRSVTGTKRQTDTDNSSAPTAKKTPLLENRNNEKDTRLSAAGDKCGICQKRVYLLERHIEGGKLYHRACFRHSELSPTNKVYTRSPFLSPSLKSETTSFVYPDHKATSMSDARKDDRSTQSTHTAQAKTKANSGSLSVSKKSDIVGTKGLHEELPKDSIKLSEAIESKHFLEKTPRDNIKKSEGAGTKHLLEEQSSESSKKSKLQAGTLQDIEKLKKASILKDRLHSLKAKYSGSKGSEADGALPLSGKEARKIERKREEFRSSSVKHKEELPKSSKLNISSGLYQSDKTLPSKSLKNDPVASVVATESSVSLAGNGKTSTILKPSFEKASSSGTAHSKSDSASSKNNIMDSKNSLKSAIDRLDAAGLKNKTSLDTKGPQAALSNKSGAAEAEISKTLHPVAKPRTGMSRPLSTSIVSDVSKPALETLFDKSNKDLTPKPAPRKTVLDSSEKKHPPERPSAPPKIKKPSSEQSAEETESSKSSAECPPPPLPLSPPPSLPTSKPPPLPTSRPAGDIISAPTDKEATNPSIQASQDKLNVTQTSSLVSVKLQPDPEPELRTTSTPKPQDRRWSSPATSVKNQVTSRSISEETAGHIHTRLSSLTVSIGQKPSNPTEPLSSSLSPLPNITESIAFSEGSNEIGSSISTSCINCDIVELPSTSALDIDHNESENNTVEIINVGESSNFDINMRETEKEDIKPSHADMSQGFNQMNEETIFRPDVSQVGDTLNEEMPVKDEVSQDIDEGNEEIAFKTDISQIGDEFNEETAVTADMAGAVDKHNEETSVTADMSEDVDKHNEETVSQLDMSTAKDTFNEETVSPRSSSPSVETDPSKDTFSNRYSLTLNTEDLKNKPENSDDERAADLHSTTSNSNNNDDHEMKISSGRHETTNLSDKDIPDIRTAGGGDSKHKTEKYEHESATEEVTCSEVGQANDIINSESTAPQKPPRLLKNSHLHDNKKPADSVSAESGESKTSPDLDAAKPNENVLQSSNTSDKESQPEVASQEQSNAAKDMPQWKKDIEERKKKLREDIARSEAETSRAKCRKDKMVSVAPEVAATIEDISNCKIVTEDTALSLDKSAVSSSSENELMSFSNHDISKSEKMGSITCSKENSKLEPLYLEHDQREAPFQTIDLTSALNSEANSREGVSTSRLSEGKLVLESGTRHADEDESTHTAARVKRKITVLGTNKKKGAAQSPPTSPLPMRKIEVISKFDFEKSSSDFEQSLTESASKLTIHDKHAPPPPRPPPPRSHHTAVSPLPISAIELQQQLLDIDSRLTDLELRGRDLEDSIRNVEEEDDDALMVEWFKLVSEKNELVRKEADLVHITKQQDLEDEQEHIESQLRYLLSKSDDSKSAEERLEEAYLIKRKLELVEQRNKIVDSMDEDRLRYETEDRDIKEMMKDKALWRNSSGSLSSATGKRVSKSMFYS